MESMGDGLPMTCKWQHHVCLSIQCHRVRQVSRTPEFQLREFPLFILNPGTNPLTFNPVRLFILVSTSSLLLASVITQCGMVTLFLALRQSQGAPSCHYPSAAILGQEPPASESGVPLTKPAQCPVDCLTSWAITVAHVVTSQGCFEE